MVRSFRTDPVPAEVLDRVLDAARRAPSAGNSQGWAFVVLEGPAQTARFWDVTFPGDRAGFRFPSLFEAPVLVLPLAHARTYVERYREPDKESTGLGAGEAAWPVDYWTVDTSFATMSLLLASVDEGLGALFFGIFEHQHTLLSELGVPSGYEPIGAVALGWPAARQPGGTSATRPRRPIHEVIHRGAW
jgi:nitroreductase